MERKREDRGVQAAARRAYVDLYACYLSIRTALEENAPTQVKEMRSRLDRYREHESIFAIDLRITHYLLLAVTVRRLSLFIQQGQVRPAPAMSEDERRELESLRKRTEAAGDELLDVAIRGPAHMWGQRGFRRVRRGVMPQREKRRRAEILELVEELVRLPPEPQTDRREDDGPEGRGPEDPPSA
jgi:hypothetical protein